jgi:hypothetical protein
MRYSGTFKQSKPKISEEHKVKLLVQGDEMVALLKLTWSEYLKVPEKASCTLTKQTDGDYLITFEWKEENE